MASSLRPSSTFLARSGVVADQRAKRPARAAAVVRASAPQQQPPNGTRSKPGPARAAYTAEYVSSATWNAAPAQQQHWGAPPAPHGLKDSLLLAVNDTKRGALTTRDVRGEVEELQVGPRSVAPGPTSGATARPTGSPKHAGFGPRRWRSRASKARRTWTTACCPASGSSSTPRPRRW